MIAWIYLFVASCLEVCWIYSLKYLSVQKIRAIDWSHSLTNVASLSPLLPLLGYIVFGLTNIVLFSLAMKQIPASTAFATWMSLALLGVKLVDTLVFKESFSYVQVVSMGLILLGIIGLKKTM